MTSRTDLLQNILQPVLKYLTIGAIFVPLSAFSLTGGFESKDPRFGGVVKFEFVRSSDGVFSSKFCGGAVISESKILTAKHCVKWIFNQSDNAKEFDIERDVIVISSNMLNEPKRFKIESIQLSPPTTYFDFDLAIIEVNASLELPQYEILDTVNLHEADKISIVTAGYGCDLVADPTYLNSGGTTVKIGERKVQNFNSIYFQLKKQNVENANSFCPGDSGSPAFIDVDGKLVVIGVNQSLRLEKIMASDIDSHGHLKKSAFINSKFNTDLITRVDKIADDNNKFWLRSILTH